MTQPLLPEFFGGSADLTGSNLTNFKGCIKAGRDTWGNHLSYGVREFGMAGIMNGIAGLALIVGGAVYLVLGFLHALYTFLDIGQPRRIVPRDLALIELLQKERIRLAGEGTTFWRGWVGFNFSHSLGALLFGSLCVSAGVLLRSHGIPRELLLVPILVGAIYTVLAVKYWFRIPIVATAIAELCFVAAFVAY